MGPLPEAAPFHMQTPEQVSTDPTLPSGDALIQHQQEQIAKLQKLQQEMALQSQKGLQHSQGAAGVPSSSLPVSSNGSASTVDAAQPTNDASSSNPPFFSESGQTAHQPRVSFHAGVRAPAPMGPLNMTSSMTAMQQLSGSGSFSALGNQPAQMEGSSMGAGSALENSEQKWQTDSDLPHRREFIRLIAQLLTERKHNPSQKWLLELPYKARKLEEQLYRTAPSFEHYIDRSTLKQRLKKVATAITFKFRDAKRKSLTKRSSSISSTTSDWTISSPSASPPPPPQALNGEDASAPVPPPPTLADVNAGGIQPSVNSTTDELERTQALSQSLQEKIMANIAAQKQLMMSLGIGGPTGQDQQQQNVSNPGLVSSQTSSAQSSFAQDQFNPFLPMGNNDNNNMSATGLQNMMRDNSMNTNGIASLSSQNQLGFVGQPMGQRFSVLQQSGQGLPVPDLSTMQPQSSAKIDNEPISHNLNGDNDVNGDDNPPMTPETFGW